MILTKELIAKGLVGTTMVVAPTTLGIVYRKEISQALSSSEGQQPEASNDAAINALLEKVGLSCSGGTNNDECSQKTGSTTNIKHGDTKEKSKTLTIPTNVKIKLYKNTNDYNEKAKFVIEGGNITLTTTATGTTITQLEEFETYEIKEETEGSTKEWYFSRVKTANEEKKRILGLPEDATCTLPTTDNGTSTCSDINADKLKKINFDGKGENGATIDNAGTDTVTLTITKVDSTDSIFGTGGYKFAFASNKDITISSSNKIMKNTNTEFKIKKEGTSLSLEKAWNVTNLAGKIGLTGCAGEADATKECTFGSTINVFNSDSEYVTGANVTDNTNKKITFAVDTEGFNQGYKFTVSSSDISVNGSSGSGTINSIAATDYEIKEQTVGGNKWFLSKKST